MLPLLLLAGGALFVNQARKRTLRAGGTPGVDGSIFSGASTLAPPPNNLGVGEGDGGLRDIGIDEFLRALQLEPRTVVQLSTDGTFSDDDISVLPVVQALQRCCPGG